MNLICFRDAYGGSLCLIPEETCQFTSHEYKDFLKENGIRQSMDGKSRWADNIMIERWFRTFKYDEAYLTEWHNIKEARQHFFAKSSSNYLSFFNDTSIISQQTIPIFVCARDCYFQSPFCFDCPTIYRENFHSSYKEETVHSTINIFHNLRIVIRYMPL